MSRPAILPLPDAQANILVQELQPILGTYQMASASHRDFVREFIRAVHRATGRTYNPTIYRKLLTAYAPGRSPSTDTLAQEKKAFDAELAVEAEAGRQISAESGQELAAVVQRAVNRALANYMPTSPREQASPDRYLQAQVDFLQTRLLDSERMLTDARAHAARLAAELQAAQAVRTSLDVQLAAANELTAAQGQRMEQLTTELAGLRKFAMTAIDGSRGETRAQQERAAYLESLLKTEKTHSEVFRRLAYRSGAAIPESLLEDNKR